MYVEKFESEPIDITLVSFGFSGMQTIIEAHENSPDDLKIGLTNILGSSGSFDKEEKIFQVRDGKPVFIE